ncbi:MAG: RagB/SusD family nutrient uptake outer membrane protein [Prevotella sp.]|nr:RagB/SusD family nutrient uptake outer membrane protein [Prevotella sp.]
MNILRKRSRTIRITGLLFVICSLLFSVSACSDFLEIEPQELIVLDKFWNEEADVENMVAGCYSTMQREAVISRMMAWGEFRSDNTVGGTGIENAKDLSNIFKENINASNSYAKWGDFYNVINRCNTILYYAPQVAQKDPNYTQSELLATEAEVKALRDLMYFYLIRTFRDVPYYTQPYLDDNQTMNLPATKFEVVLDSLIADLEAVQGNAVRRYPTNKTYYQQGRITQDAIHAMLADMYLWKRDYQKAIYYADLVIDAKTAAYQEELDKMSGSVSANDRMIDGYPLISDAMTTGNYYGNAFQTIFSRGASRESIFELVYSDNDQMLANSAVSYHYGNATTFPGDVRPADFLCTDVNDEVFSVFLSKNDARYYENLQSINGSRTLFGINKYTFRSTTVDLTKAEIQGSYGSPYVQNLCHANWIIYRLTDIMLLKAEALVELAPDSVSVADSLSNLNSAQGDLQSPYLEQAFSIVNTISKRSNCSSSSKDLDQANYSTKSLMRALVQEERQRELMFEGKRWYDLVRRSQRDDNTDYLVGCVSRKGGTGGAIASKLSRMEAIYWPYHIDEIKVNDQLLQNPAFGSGEDSSYERTK